MSDSAPQSSVVRVIFAGLIGNVMEWYDFAVYGYFASVIGTLFFPASDPAVSLIASFGAFAAGFLVRPLGGLVFGRIGDLAGRQRALTWSVIAMALPTVLMALLPTYDSIGIAAPVAIVALRDVFGKYRWSVLRVALLNVGFGVSFYAAFIYAVSYIRDIDKLPQGLALRLNTWAMVLLLLVMPVAAWLSDRYGRKNRS